MMKWRPASRPGTRLECTCLDFEALWSTLWTGNGNLTGNLQIITREALASLELKGLTVRYFVVVMYVTVIRTYSTLV